MLAGREALREGRLEDDPREKRKQEMKPRFFKGTTRKTSKGEMIERRRGSGDEAGGVVERQGETRCGEGGVRPVKREAATSSYRPSASGAPQAPSGAPPFRCGRYRHSAPSPAASLRIIPHGLVWSNTGHCLATWLPWLLSTTSIYPDKVVRTLCTPSLSHGRHHISC